MSVCNLHANCNLIVKSTISRQTKGYSTYMRYRGQGMLRIYLQFAQFAQFAHLQCQITKCTICQIAMSVCNLHANCNLIVKSTISRQVKGYSTYMRYSGQGLLRIYLQFAQFATCQITKCTICQIAMSVCNLHANCNLIVKSITISRQGTGQGNLLQQFVLQYLQVQGTGYYSRLEFICNLFAICAICNVKLQNVQFVKLQCQFAICMQIAT